MGSNKPPNKGVQVGEAGADFRIDFSVIKKRSSSANTANIRIYNLSRETRDSLDSEWTRITLEAGYQGDTAEGEQGFWGVIFDGWIKKIVHSRSSNGDIITSMDCIDGGVDWANSRINATYTSGTPYRDVVRSIVSKMELVTLRDVNAIPVDSVVNEGRSHTFSSTCRKALDTICRNHDCRWTINNNVVEIVKNNEGLDDNLSIPIISSTTGMVGSPSVTEKGVRVRSLIHPNIEPNRLVYIVDDLLGTGRFNKDGMQGGSGEDGNSSNNNTERSVSDGAGGVYRVNSVTFSGSNEGGNFHCDMNCQRGRPQTDYSPVARVVNKWDA